MRRPRRERFHRARSQSFYSFGSFSVSAEMTRKDREESLKLRFARGEISFEEYSAMLSGENTLGRRIRRNLSYLLLLIVVVVVVGFVLTRLRIVVLVPISWWLALLLLGAIILVLFLVLDHFVNPD